MQSMIRALRARAFRTRFYARPGRFVRRPSMPAATATVPGASHQKQPST
ncbi:hypothetical protein [Lysobacter gummosus]